MFSLLFLSFVASAAVQVPLAAAQNGADAPYKVAVIGAGAGGSGATFWLSKAAKRLGKDIQVDLFERNDYIGGRSTIIHPYNDDSIEPVELGASIFTASLLNMVRATQEFNFTTYPFSDPEFGSMGIWDGAKFALTQGMVSSKLGQWLDNLLMLLRYGTKSPTVVGQLVTGIVVKFLDFYSTVTSWNSIEELSTTMGWANLTTVLASEHLAASGVNPRYTFEMVEGISRINYGQDIDTIHALEGLASLASTGSVSVAGGNRKIFNKFVDISNATKHLSTAVTSVEKTSSGKWSVKYAGASGSNTSEFDSVIIASPLQFTNATFPESIAKFETVPYAHLYVTLFTTTSKYHNAEYFGLRKGSPVPALILTSDSRKRDGKTGPEFNSASYLRRVKPGKDEWIIKIFSNHPISDEWLAKNYQGLGWVYRKEWDAYPLLHTTSTYPPLALDDGLYYVNGFEKFISTMETEIIASRGVVNLLLNKAFGQGICPAGVTSPTPAGLPPVWGWDC